MEKNEITVKKPTVNNLECGNVYRAGYVRRGIDNRDLNRFVGFKVNGQFFTNLKQLKAHFGVTNLRELEFEADRLELGSITAEWFNTEERYFWGAYLWNGGFKVGSSADALKLATAA